MSHLLERITQLRTGGARGFGGIITFLFVR